jgi:hypothetical protein
MLAAPTTAACMLMSSTPLAYPQVVSRCFVDSNSAFPQFTPFYAPGSIPGSSTEKTGQGQKPWPVSFFTNISSVRYRAEATIDL